MERGFSTSWRGLWTRVQRWERGVYLRERHSGLQRSATALLNSAAHYLSLLNVPDHFYPIVWHFYVTSWGSTSQGVSPTRKKEFFIDLNSVRSSPLCAPAFPIDPELRSLKTLSFPLSPRQGLRQPIWMNAAWGAREGCHLCHRTPHHQPSWATRWHAK